jgi:hypothetical protein
LAITISGISLVGLVLTAVVGPIIVERRKSARQTVELPEVAVIAQRASDAVALIQHEITDLQYRVGRLDALAAEIRRLAQGAHELGVAANEELAAPWFGDRPRFSPPRRPLR